MISDLEQMSVPELLKLKRDIDRMLDIRFMFRPGLFLRGEE